MVSTPGQDEAILNNTKLSVTKFYSYISSVCHLALSSAMNGSAIEGQASGFLAKFTLDGSRKIVVVMNNHFVASKEDASRILATFKYEGKNEIKTVKLDPEIFFRTNQKPDYTFVGISEQDVNELRENYGVTPVKLEQTRLTVQVNVDVIHIPQHPDGKEKRMSHSKICAINDSEVFYTADTSFGSSGSPVLYCQSNNMYVLALHKDGGVKLPDGSLANRGILMSAILDHMCGVTVCITQDVYPPPIAETRETIRIAGRICGEWIVVAKLTKMFENWEINNIMYNNNIPTPLLKADQMLTDFKSRLGSREVLAEAITMSGNAVVGARVRSGYYIDNNTD